MSPRAAWRLESLGFSDVYDYVGSKMDWIGEHLPFEGTLTRTPRLSTLATTDVPTCTLEEPLSALRSRLGAWPFCFVVSGSERVVLGLIPAEVIGEPGLDQRAVEAMREGPSTYRPHVSAREMGERLVHHPVPWVVVTTLSGRLLGVANPSDIQAAAEGAVAS